MHFQRIFALTKKDFKRTVREPAVLFMIFLFPMVFVLAFGASFGGTGSGPTHYNISVVNLDHTASPGSQTFIDALTNTKILTLNMHATNQTAQDALSQGKVQAIVIIPNGFGQSLNSYNAAPNSPDQWTNTTVLLYLDKGSIVATQAIPPIIQQVLTSMVNPTQQVFNSPLTLETASLVDVKTTSALDFLAPGMFTFASIFLIMMVGQSFAQDRENGMMKRIRITPTTPTEFIASQVISYMSIALTQAALVFIMTYFMGFKPNVDMSVYAFAFVMVLVFSLSNVGFGLITATIAKSSGAATGIAFIFVLPQLFLGTFVGAQLSSTAQIAGKFVPSYYVTDALTSLFLRGAAITSQAILLDLGIISASCIAILAFGVALYSKYFKI